MRGVFVLLIVTIQSISALAEQIDVYLIPGQGADYRLFDSLEFEDHFKIHHIKYFTPERGVDLNGFARQLSTQIDTTKKYVIIGVSLGGMIASEMSTFLNPEKVIVISSAKGRDELPHRYRFQKMIPLFEIFPPGIIKFGARTLQPLVEPDRKNNKKTFKSMLKAKDPKFLKRTIRMIVNWDLNLLESEIIHVHGEKDHTLPVKKVKCDYEIEKGSHMMVLTKDKEVSAILKKELNSHFIQN